MRKLLVGLAVLLLATQAQAEVIDFAGMSNGEIGEYGPWESGDYVMTLSDPAVDVTFGGDTGEIGWYLYNEHLQMEKFEPGYAYLWFSATVEVPSLVIGPENGSGSMTGTVAGFLGVSEVWSAALDVDGWTTFTNGAGQDIDSLRFDHSSGNCIDIDDIEVVPEPATLALLGLGGLGLLIRRRR